MTPAMSTRRVGDQVILCTVTTVSRPVISNSLAACGGAEATTSSPRRWRRRLGGADEHTQAGGVDEVDAGEVEDDPALAGMGQLPQDVTEPGGAVAVDLALQLDCALASRRRRQPQRQHGTAGTTRRAAHGRRRNEVAARHTGEAWRRAWPKWFDRRVGITLSPLSGVLGAAGRAADPADHGPRPGTGGVMG